MAESEIDDRIVEHIPPRTALEDVVSSLVADVLNLGQVGVRDNFFELGGDSIIATRLNTRIEEILGVKLPLRACLVRSDRVFRSATVQDARSGDEGLAALFRGASDAADRAVPPERRAEELIKHALRVFFNGPTVEEIGSDINRFHDSEELEILAAMYLGIDVDDIDRAVADLRRNEKIAN